MSTPLTDEIDRLRAELAESNAIILRMHADNSALTVRLAAEAQRGAEPVKATCFHVIHPREAEDDHGFALKPGRYAMYPDTMKLYAAPQRTAFTLPLKALFPAAAHSNTPTPDTDAATIRMERLDGDFDDVVSAKFAAQLERQRNELRSALEAAELKLSAYAPHSHYDQLQARVRELESDIRTLIKALPEPPIKFDDALSKFTIIELTK